MIKKHKYVAISINVFFAFLNFLMCLSNTSAQEYIIKNYTVSEGLVQPFIIDIFNDPQGYIWFIANEGISRFDGFEFKNYKETSEFFNYRPVRASIDSLGIIYIRNIANQIWKWDGIKFSKLDLPKEYPGLTVASMKISGRRNLLVATFEYGIFLLEGNKWHRYSTEDGLYSDSVSHISEYFDGVNYIATLRGICKFENGKITKVVPTKNLMINTIIPDDNGNLWITAYNQGIRLYDSKNIRVVDTPPDLLTANAYKDHENNIWFATLEGLMRFNINKENKITRTTVIRDATSTISIDKDKNIWVGTFGNGAYKVSKNPFTSFRVEDGLPSNLVYPIREDRMGKIIAGTTGGLAKLNGKRWQTLSSIDKIFNNPVRRISKDSSGFLYISVDKCIIKYDGINFTYVVGKGEFPHTIVGYNEDKNGTEWIGTADNGIWKNISGRWIQQTLNSLDPNISIMIQLMDSNGIIWCGSRLNGLFKIENGQVTQFNITNGLLSNAIVDMAFDDKENLWLATLGGINAVNNDTVFKSITVNDGLVTNACYAIMWNNDKLYIGTSNGLNIYDGKDFLLLTTIDGLPNNDINSSSFLVDSKENVWMGTVGGAVYFDPETLLSKHSGVNPVILKISSAQKEVELLNGKINLPEDTELVFESEDNYIRIDFTGINFKTSHGVVFQYYLNGLNDSWVDNGNNRFIEFRNLPPGNYKFNLRVKIIFNEWSDKPVYVSFSIRAPFYYSVWFYLIALSIIFGATYYFAKRSKRFKRHGPKYSTSTLNAENYKKIFALLKHKIEVEKKYTDPELTLKKLADEMLVNKEHLSEVINKEYKMNFNDYINMHRVNEAKFRLNNPNEDVYKILNIGLDAGFNSKSTFNSAFKKFTGMTPSKYRISRNKAN